MVKKKEDYYHQLEFENVASFSPLELTGVESVKELIKRSEMLISDIPNKSIPKELYEEEQQRLFMNNAFLRSQISTLKEQLVVTEKEKKNFLLKNLVDIYNKYKDSSYDKDKNLKKLYNMAKNLKESMLACSYDLEPDEFLIKLMNMHNMSDEELTKFIEDNNIQIEIIELPHKNEKDENY